jgi:hypothetical protein
VYGKVTETTTGEPVRGICVTLGVPGALCWAITDSAGNYAINGDGTVQPGSQWNLYFFTCNPGVRSLDGRTCTNPTPGYASQPSNTFTLSGNVLRVDWAIHR